LRAGARNTLRLEAGNALYGHEITDSVNVYEAGWKRWLKLDKGEFIGREALLAVQAAGGPKRKLVALEMVERGIARDSYPVLDLDGNEIGKSPPARPRRISRQHCLRAAAHGRGCQRR